MAEREVTGREVTRRAGREGYRVFSTITTRWMDNDAYQHLNNVVYYSLFDTVVNETLIRAGLLDVESSATIGLVVESGCRYHASIAFPDVVTAGLRIAHLGRSSVRYEIALFRGDELRAAAEGHFVHVHVDRATKRPVALPDGMRAFLEGLCSPAESGTRMGRAP